MLRLCSCVGMKSHLVHYVTDRLLRTSLNGDGSNAVKFAALSVVVVHFNSSREIEKSAIFRFGKICASIRNLNHIKRSQW